MVLQRAKREDEKLVCQQTKITNAGQGRKATVNFDTVVLIVCENPCLSSVFVMYSPAGKFLGT